MKQDELTREQNSKGPMKQGPVEKGQNGSGLSGIRPNRLRTNWEDPSMGTTEICQNFNICNLSSLGTLLKCVYSTCRVASFLYSKRLNL